MKNDSIYCTLHNFYSLEVNRPISTMREVKVIYNTCLANRLLASSCKAPRLHLPPVSPSLEL